MAQLEIFCYNLQFREHVLLEQNKSLRKIVTFGGRSKRNKKEQISTNKNVQEPPRYLNVTITSSHSLHPKSRLFSSFKSVGGLCSSSMVVDSIKYDCHHYRDRLPKLRNLLVSSALRLSFVFYVYKYVCVCFFSSFFTSLNIIFIFAFLLILSYSNCVLHEQPKKMQISQSVHLFAEQNYVDFRFNL